MKLAIITTTVLLALCPPAFAQSYTTHTYGNRTVVDGDDGYSASSHTRGNLTITNDSDGRTCTSHRYGNRSTTDCD
jgi:hypothetical protein